jgi:hypothetical protein
MERLQELFTQLKEQFDRKAEPSQMLHTTRLLEAELQRLAAQQAVAGKVSAKVAVMMPSSMKIYTGQSAMQELKTAPEIKNFPPVTAPVPVAAAPTPVVEVPVVNATAMPVSGGKEPERGAWPFDPLADRPADRFMATDRPIRIEPTQQKPLELNDAIASRHNGSSSLNDKLKSDVLELKSALNDTPVRDLKKAIGVNDRYVFINQLFRGDEVMYERSLKTINGFRILPEAEYWMERELKVKLGWDENREATRQFYQLVKRRFS